MLKPNDLDKRRLVDILNTIIDVMYFDEDANKFDPNKEWDAETIDSVAEILRFYNLIPDEESSS